MYSLIGHNCCVSSIAPRHGRRDTATMHARTTRLVRHAKIEKRPPSQSVQFSPFSSKTSNPSTISRSLDFSGRIPVMQSTPAYRGAGEERGRGDLEARKRVEACLEWVRRGTEDQRMSYVLSHY
jgi:hypothetical protein